MKANEALDIKKPSQANAWWELIPFNYENIRLYPSTRPQGFRFEPHIINIAANFNGTDLVVCGEAETLELAHAKAISELIERSSLIQYAETNSEIQTSNGWAAHPESDIAEANAIYELIERDAVLKHWYSYTPYSCIDINTMPLQFQSWASEELAHSEFPKFRILVSNLGIGPSVSCLLMNDAGFGVSGHCSKKDLASAIKGAIAEACRSAHHSIQKSYFSDTVALAKGSSEKRINPGAHSVYYAYQEPFPSWMFGQTLTWQQSLNIWDEHQSRLHSDLSVFELTKVLEEPISVVFATHKDCLPLLWGPTNFEILESIFEDSMTLKEISKDGKVNLKPHIVA